MNKLRDFQNHVSQGNHKVGKDTLIFNMTSASECPADKLGLCKISSKCYAKKAEIQYRSVLPYRRRQAKLWNNLTFVQIAQAIGEKALRSKKVKVKYFRFSEAGDFRSHSDVYKMQGVAKYLYDNYDILTYGYTARTDLILPSKLNYFVINLSDSVTSEHNNFKPVKAFTGQNLECKGSCIKCKLCKVNHGKTIEVIVH